MAGRITLPLLYAAQEGAAASPPQVSVFNHGTSTLATLYTDKTAGTTAANPITVGSLGDLSFFAAAGDYDVEVTLGEETDVFTVTVNDAPGAVIQSLTPAAGALAVNALLGNVVEVAPSGNVTGTTVTGLITGQRFTIIFVSDGSHTYTYPTTCKYAGGAAAAASSTTGYKDLYEFLYDGTNLLELGRSIGIH